jgi:excisionase family DNA binding protein
MSDMLTIEEAASALGCSTRTIQRRVASGQLAAALVDGRTMVAVERPSGEAIAALRRQAEDTGKVAALAAVTGQGAALAYRERAEELERRVAEVRHEAARWRRGSMVAAAAAVAALVTLSWTWGDSAATRDTLTDMRTQLERAEDARRRLEEALAGATRGDMVAQDVTPKPGVPWSLALVP